MGSSFRDLIVWQRSLQMTVAVYKATDKFPAQERYGLTNQLRRASVSVPSNIAEGYARGTSGEYRSFLGIARGSNAEVATQLMIARELRFGGVPELDHADSLVVEVGKMLNAILKKV